MARRFYNEQEPGLYEDQTGDLYYDPNTGEFVSASDASSISAPEPAPESQPVRGLSAATTAFRDDDYTGRMGPDGEPERYSTMRGGDPRLAQQRELEVQQERLQKPVTIRSWMTTNTKDVRGEKPADNITLQPGRQYQIVDFTGKNNGEVIASGSTPEEFLRIQDIAENLASKGRMADWRLQEVSDEPSESKFGSALEPTTGKYITTLGGDLYNKSGWSTVADIAKIAAPIALQFIPGLGTALGTSILGAKAGATGATLGAKILGAGLTSAIGRTGAGVVTGEKLGEALKAGAVSGLASGATAGLLGVTKLDEVLNSALGGAKSAAAEKAVNFTPVPGAGGMTPIPVNALANLKSSLIPASAFSGLAPSATAPIVVTGLRNAVAPGLSQLVAGATPEAIRSIVSAAEILGNAPPTTEEGVVVTGQRIPDAQIGSGIGGATLDGIRDIVSATESLGYAPPTVEEELLAEGRRYQQPSIATALTVPVSQTYPIAEGATDVLPDDEALVEGRRIQPPPIDASLVGLPVTAAIAAPAVLAGGAAPQGPLGTNTPSTVDAGTAGAGGLTAREIANGITAANVVGGLVSDALGGGGGGTIDPGTGYTVPSGPARQIRGTFNDNPFTYGQKGGQILFFGDGMAEGGEVDDDMVKHLIAYRKGGGHMGPGQVKGIGSGQDDKIPAWLSDGEYVWSAQDVADLGDGSTDEGVRRLDKMRQMVRKGAGRKDVKKIAKPQRGIEDMLKAVGGAV